MGLRINTNVASMAAQHNLSKSSAKKNVSLTRLSTGLRINSGKDDSVGLAKSESLRGQIRGVDVAKANISNGTSVLGVAEGYLSALTDIAQSMREVAVQAADGTLSGSDRTSLGTKLSDLKSEYSRLANNANFNGVNLLDGSFTSKSLQVGAKEGETISVSIADARAATVGQVALLTAQTRSATAATYTAIDFGDPSGITINSIGVTTFSADGVSADDSDESALAYVTAINAASTGVTATVLSNVQTFTYTTSAGLSITGTSYILLNGVTVRASGDATLSAGSDTDFQNLVTLINNKSSQTGVTAAIDTTNDTITLTATDGRNISVQMTAMSTQTFFGTSTTTIATGYRGTFKLSSASAFTVAGAAAEFASGASVTAAVSTSTSLAYADVGSSTNASTAISIMDNVIAQLQTKRGTVGSTSNRLDIAAAELDSRQENLSSAESTIRDADIAAETAKLTQASILQQAGVTVLAQANSAPQIALTLLQNI